MEQLTAMKYVVKETAACRVRCETYIHHCDITCRKVNEWSDLIQLHAYIEPHNSNRILNTVTLTMYSVRFIDN